MTVPHIPLWTDILPRLSTVEDALHWEQECHRLQAEAATAERTRILQKYGTPEAYFRALRQIVITTPGAELERSYPAYHAIIAAERPAPLDVLQRRFLKNEDSGLQDTYGPFFYRVLSLEEPETGECVAQSHYIVSLLPAPLNSKYDAAVWISATFIRPQSRLPDFAAMLVRAIGQDIKTLLKLSSADRIIPFINNLHPLATTPREFLIDSMKSGIDAFARMAWFRGLGFRLLDLDNYRRPASLAGAKPYDGYKYSARVGPEASSIDGEMFLYQHQRFCVCIQDFPFDPQNDPCYRPLAEEVKAKGQITFQNLSDFYFSRLRRQIRDWLTANRLAAFDGPEAQAVTFGEHLNISLK